MIKIGKNKETLAEHLKAHDAQNAIIKIDPTFVILYPGGTEDVPGILGTSQRRVIPNPFPGYYIDCITEIYVNGEWGAMPFHSFYNGGHYGQGIHTCQLNDKDIVIVTGSNLLCYNNSYHWTISAFPFYSIPGGNISSAYFRIKVKKIAKIIGLSNEPFVQQKNEPGTVADQLNINQELGTTKFTIVYPFGGTKEKPAAIGLSQKRYIPNPFPGYYIKCVPEILINGEWGYISDQQHNSNGFYGHGTYAAQLDAGDITLITGSYNIVYQDAYRFNISGAPHTSIPSMLTSAPIRIKVWTVGKVEK